MAVNVKIDKILSKFAIPSLGRNLIISPFGVNYPEIWTVVNNKNCLSRLWISNIYKMEKWKNPGKLKMATNWQKRSPKPAFNWTFSFRKHKIPTSLSHTALYAIFPLRSNYWETKRNSSQYYTRDKFTIFLIGASWNSFKILNLKENKYLQCIVTLYIQYCIYKTQTVCKYCCI